MRPTRYVRIDINIRLQTKLTFLFPLFVASFSCVFSGLAFCILCVSVCVSVCVILDWRCTQNARPALFHLLNGRLRRHVFLIIGHSFHTRAAFEHRVSRTSAPSSFLRNNTTVCATLLSRRNKCRSSSFLFRPDSSLISWMQVHERTVNGAPSNAPLRNTRTRQSLR